MTRRVLLAVAALVIACQPSRTPTGDTLRDLAVAVEAAERAAPVARAACGLAPEEQRAACVGAADALALAAEEGREALAMVQSCAERQDADCLAAALDLAAHLLRVLTHGGAS